MCEDEEKRTAGDSSAPGSMIGETVAIHVSPRLCGHCWLTEWKKFGAVQNVVGSRDVTVSMKD